MVAFRIASVASLILDPRRSNPPHPPPSWVRCVAVDPGNEWFATGSADRTIKIWDLASGQLKLTLTGHIEQVRGSGEEGWEGRGWEGRGWEGIQPGGAGEGAAGGDPGHRTAAIMVSVLPPANIASHGGSP